MYIVFMKRLLFILLLSSISFVFGTLVSPSDGDELNYIHILFEWEQQPDAIYYNLQVMKNDDVIVDINEATTIYIDTENLGWDDTYYWKVRPVYSDENYGDWIGTSMFSISQSTPPYIDEGVEIESSTDIYQDDLLEDGYVAIGAFSPGLHSFIIDKYGNEIWNSGILLENEGWLSDGFMLNHINEYGNISGYSGLNYPYNTGMKANTDMDVVWSTMNPEPVDMHEFKQISNGNYMGFQNEYTVGPIPSNNDMTENFQAIGYQADGVTPEFPWFGQKIVEWNSDHEVVWSWNPFDHFSMDDFDLYGGTWWNAYFEGAFDWMHSNAFYFDEEESVIYFSSRHLSRVTKIDYPSGDIIWMIGMPSEYNTGDEHICTDLGFTWQHNVNLLDNGNITLFDNGNLSELFGESETTRALEFRVIDDTYCEMIWEYTLPNYLFGPWMGSVQTLPNGNKLINTVGSGGHALEVTSDQQLVWDASYNITGGGDPAGNYRTFRIPSIHPNAYSVIFDNYQTNESESGIYLSENILKLIISNKSGYKQLYRYSMNDSQGWFDSIESQEIFIDPYSEIQLSFDANYTSDITNFYFDIQPIYHDYDQKNYSFSIYRNQILGDINSDDTINVLDVVILVSIILGNSDEISNADVNLDGTINVLDVVTLINIILS